MSTSYTGCDIEIHLTDWTQAWDVSETDVEATNSKARELVEAAVAEAFPGYSVAVYMDGHTAGDTRRIVRLPADLDEEEIIVVIDAVGADTDAYTVAAPTAYTALAEAFAHETSVCAEVGSYTVYVGEHDEWASARDDADPEAGRLVSGYLLTICVAGMPPHFTRFFETLADVEAYIASGAILNTTAFRWLPVEE